ncbi:MAG: methylation-associated defense system protein MAD4 [Saprospiraceae bacterium]
MIDLIAVVADGHQEKVLEALFLRIPKSSGTSVFSFDIIKNAGKDSGTYNDSHELLRPFINQYRFALVVFDFDGSGVEHLSREQVEKNVQELLDKNGWQDRSAVIVIRPELENWMWVDNPNVQQAIGWENEISLYDWAKQEGWLPEGTTKPIGPKGALEKAMFLSGTPKSAAVYGKIAATVSYSRCSDAAFLRMIQQIKDWFPLPSTV